MSVFVKILGAVFDGIQAPQGGLTQFENDQEKPKITKNMLGLHDNGTLICLVCPAYTPLQGDQWTPTMAWRQVHRWSSASQSLAKDAHDFNSSDWNIVGLKSQDQGVSLAELIHQASQSRSETGGNFVPATCINGNAPVDCTWQASGPHHSGIAKL